MSYSSWPRRMVILFGRVVGKFRQKQLFCHRVKMYHNFCGCWRAGVAFPARILFILAGTAHTSKTVLQAGVSNA
jgi:hypothetical protein